MTDTMGQGMNELNGYARLNRDPDHDFKPRPNSLHADLLATSSSSSSDLLTPTPGAPLSVNAPPSANSSSSGMATTSQVMISSPLSAVTTPTAGAGQGSAGVESNWKRATRKLSLTGTVLGFAKKEKHKDKLNGVVEDAPRE